MRGRFGLAGALFLVLFVLVIGGIGYAIGFNAGPVAVAQPVDGVVYPVGYYHGWGFGWGFPLFGFLFFFLFIGLLFAAFGRRRWAGGPGWGGKGWGGPGSGPGYGGWYGPGRSQTSFDPDDPRVRQWLDKAPPELQAMLEAWHRQAHGTGGSTGSGGSTGTSDSFAADGGGTKQ